MKEYLEATEIIDWQHPNIVDLASSLAVGKTDSVAIAKACFEWVRDEIKHSCDYQMNPVTCLASEVLQHQTGYCYAKSHLLAALLRANQIPAGFCYQRLSVFGNSDQSGGAPFCLHGLNAVYLPEYGWYRVDARGNKEDVAAQFTPPREQLAFKLNFAEEIDCDRVFAQPLDIVVQALQKYQQWDQLLANLPDSESI